MKRVWLLLVLAPAVFVACASSNPRVENCKMACENKGRHSSEQIGHCKSMCEKYQ